MTPLALALALTLRGYAQTAPSLMRPHLAAAADAVEEIARLRAERDEARADALALATERNNWQSMYQDAMAERDEARALLRKVPVGSEFRSDWGNWVKKRDAALNGEKNNGIS